MMFKKQALIFFYLALAVATGARALGLGDIELNSNLNEPLDARIELRELGGLTEGEILPSLAGNEAFTRAGVERNFFLSNIQFDVVEGESGNLELVLSTSQPVREPFLNFLVEVNWPGGRLLKEFTLLLDPPVFDSGVVGESLVVEPAAPSDESEITTSTRVTDSETTSEAQPAEVAPREEDLAEDEYRVQRNDTLWEIAARVEAGDGYLPHQVMLAIQDLNPEAFLNNNINRVKAGSLLNLPSEAQIAARSRSQAIEQVRQQNEGLARSAGASEPRDVQLSATESTSSALPEGEGERDPDGYLEVSADEQSAGSSAGGEASVNAEIERLENELAIAGELNDQFEREREALEGRVAELEEQINIMQRMLNLQSGDAATLQAELAELEAQDQGEAAPAESEAESAGAEADQATAGTDDPAVESESAEAADEPADQAAAEPQPAEADEPLPEPEPVPQPGILGFIEDFTAPVTDWITASLRNMILSAAIALLALVLPSYIRNRRKKSHEEDAVLAEVNDNLDEPEIEQDFDDDLLGDLDDDGAMDNADYGDEDEASDAVMEAEMYMAYQKYDQAEEKLKAAFAEEPHRTDIGLKLLEVHAETGNASEFEALAQRLSLTPDQQSRVETLRGRMPVVSGGGDDDFGMDLDDDSDLDFGGFDEPAQGEGETPSLDDLEQDLKTASGRYDLSDFDSEAQAPPAGTPAGNEEDLDFSLDLDGLDLPESENESESNTGDDDAGLDFDLGDLGLDDEDDTTKTSGEGEADTGPDWSLEQASDSDADDFDFNLEQDDSSTSAEPPTLEADDDGLDLDFSALDEEATADTGTTDENASADLDLDDLDFGDADEPEAAAEPQAPPEPEPQAPSEPDDDAVQDLAESLPGEADLDDDEFDFLSGSDEASTKLDLARAYLEMDDTEGARDILEEVATEGNDDQKRQAKELMDRL